LPVKQVNISGGGMSFFSDTPYNIGDVIELKTVLENLYPVAMYLYGKVLSCEKIDGGYKIAVEFINIDEDIRDYIVRFVFHRQRQIIRQQKEI
jgi:c-di-GMP-binding flagellar brake protein YcgR